MISSCGNADKTPSQTAKPPQSYKVIEVAKSAATLLTDYPANLQGIQDIEIRPKIDGYIEAVYVEEGAAVKKGQLLFKISNPQYEELVRSAAATINAAEADVASARLQVKKTEPLVAQDIISPYELEMAQLALQAREAQLAQAKTSLANAKINLGYTQVTSPVNGVVGTLPYKLGSYVNSAMGSGLTTVSDIARVYAYFSVNEKQGLAFFQDAEGKSSREKIQTLPAVTLVLADGTEYEEKGKVETISGQINTQTGSYNVRAGFPNPSGMLRSGSSANVRIPTYVEEALLIPQKATYELQGKRFVYVAGADSVVKATEVKVRDLPGGQLFVVDEGVVVGDRVVIEGVGILTEGTRIVPVSVDRDSLLETYGKQ